jgi:predicted amidophosphoribosyltransferase
VWKDALDGLVDLLAPRCCAACDAELDPGETGFCAGCEIALVETGEPWAPPARAAALFVYGGPLADAIRRYK